VAAALGRDEQQEPPMTKKTTKRAKAPASAGKPRSTRKNTRSATVSKDVAAKSRGRARSEKAPGRAKQGGKAADGIIRTDSKQQQMLTMLRRPEGASVIEIGEQLGWQKHTVRGVLSAVVKKKLGLDVNSAKSEDRGRVYRLAAASTR
jgi:hypothetical protein